MERGRESEKVVLKELGLEKNTEKIASKTMKEETVNVIPDAVTETRVIEIKDVKYLSKTKQIEGELNAAKQAGKEFQLFVGEKTTLSGPLTKLQEEESRYFKIYKKKNLGPR